MRFYKIVDSPYITAIGVGVSGIEVDKAEFDEISIAIQSKPTSTATVDYRLREDLTWEEYELPPQPEPEPEPEELLSILLGGEQS